MLWSQYEAYVNQKGSERSVDGCFLGGEIR
jgi:hypothetical protein